jgi:hypothetical protein
MQSLHRSEPQGLPPVACFYPQRLAATAAPGSTIVQPSLASKSQLPAYIPPEPWGHLPVLDLLALTE